MPSFFCNDTATTEIYTLSLHDALPISVPARAVEEALDLVGLVQVRLVRRERAVLAVAAAGPGERQRQVAREGDAAGHRVATIPGCARDRKSTRLNSSPANISNAVFFL